MKKADYHRVPPLSICKQKSTDQFGPVRRSRICCCKPIDMISYSAYNLELRALQQISPSLRKSALHLQILILIQVTALQTRQLSTSATTAICSQLAVHQEQAKATQFCPDCVQIRHHSLVACCQVLPKPRVHGAVIHMRLSFVFVVGVKAFFGSDSLCLKAQPDAAFSNS